MKSKDIVVMAVFVALTVVLSLLPWVFLVPLIVGSILLGKRKGLALSAVFGVVSLAYSFLSVSFVGEVFRRNLWLPVVARLPLGVICSLVFGSLKGKLRDGAVPIAAVVTSITNTVLVCGLIYLVVGADAEFADTSLFLIFPEIMISAGIEIVVAAVLPLPLVKIVRRILDIKSKGDPQNKGKDDINDSNDQALTETK